MANHWNTEMPDRVEKIEGTIDEFRKRFDRVDARFDRLMIDLDGWEARIINASKIHIDDMRDMVLKAIEVCVARVESVERTVDGMRQDWQVKWNDHEYVLRDHAARITTLEGRKKR